MSNTFETILDALKGETVLVQPRVSRETIIYVLKEHTELLRGVRKDMDVMKDTAVELRKEAAENKKNMIELNTSVSENRKNILNLEIRTNLLQEELEALRNKISEVNELRQLVKDQKAMIEDLRSSYEIFKAKTTDLNDKFRESLEAIDTKTKETAFETKELKHTVDHFGDNLILSSTQITVESTAGFSKRPQSLLDVLKTCQQNLTSMDRTLNEHTSKITENTDAIITKADATVAFAVQTLDKDVLAIKNHLKKEEDQGISAIRRSCDNLTVIVEGLQASLVDKIDRNIAEIIVQKKYEDIVQYLQDALEASSEDEDNFKNVAMELEEKIKKLASSKSDRIEIQPLQESLVKAEASIAKLMTQQREVGKSDEVYSKTEVNMLLDLKVDKEQLDDLVNHVIKSRRGKRIPGSSLSHIIDDIRSSNHDVGGNNNNNSNYNNGGITFGNGTNNIIQNEFAQDGLSILHRPNTHYGTDDNSVGSNSSIGGIGGNFGNSGIGNGNGNGGSERIGRDRSNTSKLDKKASLGGFPSSTPGVYRAPTEGGKPGGYSEKAAATTANNTNNNNTNNNLTSNSNSNKGSTVYANSVYKGVPSGLFPPANGAIVLSKSTNDLQVATGGMIVGLRRGDDMNEDFSPERGAESPAPGRSSRVGSPERQGSRDEYSYLGAATKGGGFNTRQQQSGKPPVINALSVASKNSLLSPDKEGTIKGVDGHFYTTDDPSALRPPSAGRNPEITTMKLNPPNPLSGVF